MHKALSFVKLDFITVKPYLTVKNLIIFSAVALMMIISSGTSATAIGMTMVFGALYVSYPFAVGEKNGIDSLYTTLSLARNTVVFGRYLFALIVDLCAGLVALLLSFAILMVMQKEFSLRESLIVTLVVFIIFSIIQALQLPLYFKLGYAKAKFAAYLPFVGFPLAIFMFTGMLKSSGLMQSLAFIPEWAEANLLIASILGVVVWFVIMTISYRRALTLYQKRDL